MTQPFEGGEDKKDRPKDVRIRDIISLNFFKGTAT
jgi:hypothetical protein